MQPRISETGSRSRPEVSHSPAATHPAALITGASGGLGSATARALAVAGYDLVLRSRSGCAEIASETDGLGVAGSVLDDAGIARAVETTMERFGRIDAAVFGARRHSEVMKGHKVALPPAATRENFSYETARARSSIFHGQHGRTTMT